MHNNSTPSNAELSMENMHNMLDALHNKMKDHCILKENSEDKDDNQKFRALYEITRTNFDSFEKRKFSVDEWDIEKIAFSGCKRQYNLLSQRIKEYLETEVSGEVFMEEFVNVAKEQTEEEYDIPNPNAILDNIDLINEKFATLSNEINSKGLLNKSEKLADIYVSVEMNLSLFSNFVRNNHESIKTNVSSLAQYTNMLARHEELHNELIEAVREVSKDLVIEASFDMEESPNVGEEHRTLNFNAVLGNPDRLMSEMGSISASQDVTKPEVSGEVFMEEFVNVAKEQTEEEYKIMEKEENLSMLSRFVDFVKNIVTKIKDAVKSVFASKGSYDLVEAGKNLTSNNVTMCVDSENVILKSYTRIGFDECKDTPIAQVVSSSKLKKTEVQTNKNTSHTENLLESREENWKNLPIVAKL